MKLNMKIGSLIAAAAALAAVPWPTFAHHAFAAEFDTNKPFTTVNGVTARGGSMDGPGPIVVGGMLYVNSGYGGLIGNPGNVLLAFGTE